MQMIYRLLANQDLKSSLKAIVLLLSLLLDISTHSIDFIFHHKLFFSWNNQVWFLQITMSNLKALSKDKHTFAIYCKQPVRQELIS